MKKRILFTILPLVLLTSCKNIVDEQLDLTSEQAKQNLVALESTGYEIQTRENGHTLTTYGYKDGYRYRLSNAYGSDGCMEHGSDKYIYILEKEGFVKIVSDMQIYRAEDNFYLTQFANYNGEGKYKYMVGEYEHKKIGEREFLGRKVTEYSFIQISYVKSSANFWGKIFGLEEGWAGGDITYYVDNELGITLYIKWSYIDDPWEVISFKTGNDVEIPKIIEEEPQS